MDYGLPRAREAGTRAVHVRCYGTAYVKNKVTNSLSPDISWYRLLSPGNVRQ